MLSAGDKSCHYLGKEFKQARANLNTTTTEAEHRSLGYETFFMLNSTEHEISTAHRN